MAIALHGVSVSLDADDNEIKAAAAKKMGVRGGDIDTLRVRRQSVDSRRGSVRLVYTLHITLRDKPLQAKMERRFGATEPNQTREITYGEADAGRVVVVGAGPCGLFAALTLAGHGYRPLLIERGQDMKQRESDVKQLMSGGVLNEESNICFGAGGAGAFSDGKLTTRIKDGRAEQVLQTLAECGAPNEILTLAKPHTGTEYIRAAVSRMIEKIRTLGGEVRFGCKLTGMRTRDGALCGVTVISSDTEEEIQTRAVILAIGHSARDTFSALLGNGVQMVAKPFAVGLRIEHPREMIDKAQYGEAYTHPRLGAAEYRLTSKHGGRGVYTFCMCPGGEVVCSATERGGTAVNGMSYYRRDAENSNSAIVVSVNPGDFAVHPLGGIEFQRRIERAAYEAAGGYGAPAQTVGDYLDGKATQRFGGVTPSYKPHVKAGNLHPLLPEYAAAGIAAGILDFGRKLKGFDMPEAVLTGVETRTSAPIRLPRGENMQSASAGGLFPAGEGAGYAGGIVSAAVDGIRAAEKLMETYKRP